MVHAAVAGIAGRMGSRIAQLILESEGIELIAGFEYPTHKSIGRDLSEVIGGSPTGVSIGSGVESIPDATDVIIDFTNAAASLNHIREASRRGKSIVVGSTGFTKEQLSEAAQLATSIPCVISPNMSIGVNILFKLVADAARLFGNTCDVEIIEAHHRFKKDAPSGTAVRLGQVVAEALGRDLGEVGIYGRHGLTGERTDSEIGIQTIRGGDIVGEHTVIFAGMGERVELIHRAQSRDNFARGAIYAAKWIVDQPNGLYDTSQVLGIK